MKYRKKPAEVEAFQWTGDADQEEDPDWIIKAIMDGDAWFGNIGTPDVKFLMITPTGVQEASVGDYIIREADGRMYPCKPDAFRKGYEKVGGIA